MADNVLTLEMVVKAYTEYAKMFPNIDGTGINHFWGRVFDRKKQGHSVTKDTYPETIQPVIDIIISTPDNSPQYQEMYNLMRFVAGCYSCDYNSKRDMLPDLNMFVNRAKQFKDQTVAYDALTLLKANIVFKRPSSFKYSNDLAYRKGLFKEIVYTLANNKNATLKDIGELIYFCETPEELRKVINDVFVKADEQLKIELAKDLPNTTTVQGILGTPGNVTRISLSAAEERSDDVSLELEAFIKKLSPDAKQQLKKEFGELFDNMSEKYNYDKIIGSGDAEYIQKYDDSVVKKIIEVQNQNEELSATNEKLTKENTKLTESNTNLFGEIDALKQQLEKLQEQLHQSNSDKINLQNQLNYTKGKLKMLTAAAEKVRGGLGGKGVDELRKVVQDAKTIEL